MSALATQLTDQFMASEQVELENEDQEKVVALDEAPSVGHVIYMYRCANTAHKTTIEKEPLSDRLNPK